MSRLIKVIRSHHEINRTRRELNRAIANAATARHARRADPGCAARWQGLLRKTRSDGALSDSDEALCHVRLGVVWSRFQAAASCCATLRPSSASAGSSKIDPSTRPAQLITRNPPAQRPAGT